MNTKWKVILSVMLLITAICTTFGMFFQSQFDERTAELIAGKRESAALLADTILSNVSHNYRKRIVSFTNPSFSPMREQMIRAFADRDREKLQELTLPLVKALRNENPYFATVGWILPDNHVFLRTHNPEKFGDDIAAQRPDLVAVNREKKQQFGFDVGFKSMQYRVAQPVFYKKKYIGVAQFGIRAAVVFDALRDRLQTIAGMALDNKELRDVKENNKGWLRGRSYTIISRDIGMFDAADEQLDWSLDQQRVELQGRPFVILKVLPLKNFRQDEMGLFFVALDLSEQMTQKRQLFLSVVLISSLLIIVSFLILYFSYGSLVQRIVNLNSSLEKNNSDLEHRVYERTLRLQEGERELQQILDRAPVGILIADAETRGLQYANPAICMMLGYTKEVLESLRVDDLHDQALVEREISTFKKREEGERWSVTNTPFLRKDGTYIEADIISTALRLENRLCILGFIVDQTETKKIAAQLHRAQKMEAIGLMAGGVAHDLNNILSGVVSYPELLLLQLPEDSKLRIPIIAIRESGLRAAGVVADLLTVARGAASVMESYDINLLIQEYFDSPECEKLKSLHPGMICEEQLLAEDALVSCSPLHIKKTIMNLLTNAAEAVGDTGKILVTTKNQRVDLALSRLWDIEPGYYVVLSVLDNGQGISENDLEHIFEPFYTKKKMGRSGTGLGLSVVWNTVQDHKGKVFVESSEEGTCFHLYFPVCREENKTISGQEENVVYVGSGETVLVVDDEPNLRDIASQMLSSLGYTVDSVSSGEQALEFLTKNKVDLLVIDMQMEPGMNGRQTYKKILELYPEQRAIIASGYSESDEVRAALKMGAGGFIKKPYTMEELGRAVREALPVVNPRDTVP